MHVAARIGVALAVGLGPGVAIADHDHHAAPSGPDTSFSAGIALLAAQYDTMSYGGDYQGVKPVLGWAHGRFGASATIALYRLQGNGRTLYGLGDAMFGGQMTFASNAHASAGVMTDTTHQHGPWPLVDPMNMSELTWSASSDLAIVHTRTRAITAGARLSGAVPVGESGATRVVGGVRVAWTAGKVATGLEVQAALVGDPFTVRGVLQTSVSF
jgi:hypothetical protein